jgi:hypothetical protein
MSDGEEWQKPQWEKKDPEEDPPPSLRKEEPPPAWQQQPPPQSQPQPQPWQEPQAQPPPWGAPQQPGYLPPVQPQWQQYQPGPPTPGSATAALILGICGLVICPLIGGPLALIFGYKARKQINDAPDQYSGGGMALAGIIMGWIGTALTVLFILGIIAIIAGSS